MTRTADATGLDDEAVLLIGHGSRREKSNEQVRELAAGLEDRLGLPVDVGFIELAEPSINEAVASLAPAVDEVTVVQLSLFAAGHAKNDVPLAMNRAREEHPDVAFNVGAHLGIHSAILDLLDDRVAEVEDELGVDRAEDDVVVALCGRGSSDPDANGDVCKLARLLWEGREFEAVEPAFVGITEPAVEEALRRIGDREPDAVVVVPYMLGDGVLTQRIRDWTAEFADEYPGIEAAATDPLGTDPRLVDVLADRWEEARSGSVKMSCDTCKYKVELPGFEDEAGGAEAMVHALAHQDGLDVSEEAHELLHELSSHDHGDDHGDNHDHHSHDHGDNHDHDY